MFRKCILIVLGICLMGVTAQATPIIENKEVTTVTDNLVIITWTTTNQASNTIVEYGIGGLTQVATSQTSGTLYHYATLEALYPNTTYQYRVKSVAISDSSSATGSIGYFTTLDPPTGPLLFTFATLADPQYGMGKADTGGARGRPYSQSKEILDATVQTINAYSPSFSIIKGDIVESDVDVGDTPYGDYVNTTVIPGDTKTIKGYFDTLTNSFYPLPGNHDKATTAYTGGNASSWYNNNLNPLYSGITVADPTQDTCFNYTFDYPAGTPYYRFIVLDSVKSNLRASVEVDYLETQILSAESLGLRCFIFLHHPVTDISAEGVPEIVLEEITGTSPVEYDLVQASNWAEVQSLITTHQNSVAGVFSGHIHDNHYEKISGVPYVRTAAGLQFPCGFNYYKVYTNGYIQSFVKVPYYTEIARNVLTAEADQSVDYWEQFSLGANSSRNFSHTLSAASPWVSRTSPANSAANVATNSEIIIFFTKAMSQTDTQGALLISPALTGLGYSWSEGNTVLTISHAGLTASTGYTITIGTGARDSGGTAFASPYQFSITSGTGGDTTPPVAAFDEFDHDMASDPQPTFTGIATDAASAVVSVECRIDSGSWVAATPLDGAFSNSVEAFSYRPSSSMTRRATTHQIEVRCYDSAGNVNTTYVSYSFYVVGDRPEVLLQASGATIIDGDSIDSNPSFEVTSLSNKGLAYIQAILNNGTPQNLTVTTDPSNAYIYYANYNPTLSDGTYSIKMVVKDLEGNFTTREATNLLVQAAAELRIESTPLNYPNPFRDPGTGTTAISYKLSKAANITITIHDLMGNQIYKQTYASGASGGNAGYNEVTWDGRGSAGLEVGNGIYIYLIIGDGKMLGKGKLTVLKQ